MNLSDFLGSGGFLEQRIFISSGSFTAPVSGKYLLTAIGGGGAGTARARPGEPALCLRCGHPDSHRAAGQGAADRFFR